MSTGARSVALTALALLAFAANSLLCRMALLGERIDPASFTAIRLASGAATLCLVLWLREGRVPPLTRRWIPASALLAYATAFSLAYVTLSAGTGALILFGAVQVTMILAGLRAGERPRTTEWIGLVMAFGGLVVLVRPGLAAPSPSGAALMAAAGIAWGVYSLHGRGSTAPLRDTTGNFVMSVPGAALILLFAGSVQVWSVEGALLAVLSGALASGAGYAIWYAVLPTLSATRAALVQLLVPVLAAGGGVVLLGEVVPFRLPIAAALVLGGVALAATTRPLARE